MTLNQLKTYIKGKIYKNSSKAITGNVLQDVLVEMVDTIPDNIDVPEIDPSQFATAAQGAKADTALQDASAFATKTSFDEFKDRSEGFATSAQGAKADSAPTQTSFNEFKDRSEGFATSAQGAKADTALQNAAEFATTAQGAKADSAVQSATVGGLAVTKTGGVLEFPEYPDELNPSDFATAAQGAKADTALQNAAEFATAAQGAKADTALQNAAAFATAAQGTKADNAASQTDLNNLQTQVNGKWTETTGKSWVETMLSTMGSGFFGFRGIISATPPDNTPQNTMFGNGTLWYVNSQENISNLVADTFWSCYIINNGTWSGTANTTYGIEGVNKPNVEETLGDLWHNRNSDNAFYRFDFEWKEFSANVDLSDVWTAINTQGGKVDTAIQSATVGGNAVTKSGTQLQFSAYAPLTHDHTWANITDRPTSWAYSNLTGVPTTFAPASHALNSHTGLGTSAQYLRGDGSLATFPTSMTPTTHDHLWAQITDKPTTFAPASHAITAHSGLGTATQYLRGDGSLATFPVINAVAAAGPSAAATLTFGGTFSVPGVSQAAGGQVAATSYTMTMPAAPTTITGNAGSATRLGTAGTAATATQLVLGNGNAPGTVGAVQRPIYLNAGVPTQITPGVSSTAYNMIVVDSSDGNGNLRTSTRTVGGLTQPMYLNAGVPTACTAITAVTGGGEAAAKTLTYGGTFTVLQASQAAGGQMTITPRVMTMPAAPTISVTAVSNTGETAARTLTFGASFNVLQVSQATNGQLTATARAMTLPAAPAAPTFTAVAATGPAANATLTYGGTFIVPQVSQATNGQVTATARTLTMPAAPTTVTGNAGSATRLGTSGTAATATQLVLGNGTGQGALGSGIQPIYFATNGVPTACPVTGSSVASSVVFRDGSQRIYAGGGFFQESDTRLKTVTGEVDSNYTIETFKHLKKIYYQLNDDETKTQHIGVIAQDVQKICPELVTTNEEGFLAVDYTKLSVVALSMVDNLVDRIERLEKLIEKIS